MLQELWGLFPRLMEQNINGLLDGAEPTAARVLQLYRILREEELWYGEFRDFRLALAEFYSRPRREREKSDFDRRLSRPMNHETYEGFELNFRTAVIPEKSIEDLASWAHHLIRVSKKTNHPVISRDVMKKTLERITNPGPNEKAKQIEFDDFCSAWETTVESQLGLRHDPEFDAILQEMQVIHIGLKESDRIARENLETPSVYLTRTEVDWITDVRRAAYERGPIADFPGARAPQKICLLELGRVISLYRIVRVTKDPDLAKQRENVRVTILDRCDRLLGKIKDTGTA